MNTQESGFTLTPRRSRRHPPIIITNTDFADDITLLSDTVEKAQLLLTQVEKVAAMIGLHINEKKTEYMAYKYGEVKLKSILGTIFKAVTDFKYLGSWIDSSLKDMDIYRIQMAWAAAGKLDLI